jgi:hypothetical protein
MGTEISRPQRLEHDPENWTPFAEKIMLKQNAREGMMIRRKVIPLQTMIRFN